MQKNISPLKEWNSLDHIVYFMLYFLEMYSESISAESMLRNQYAGKKNHKTGNYITERASDDPVCQGQYISENKII